MDGGKCFMNTMMMLGILIPFAGTTLGAACVFFLKNELPQGVQKVLLGFASGVMIAAGVWSLLIPSIDMSSPLKKLSFLPAAIGFLLGILFLFLMDLIIPHLHINSANPEGKKSSLKKTTMLVLAVTLHNIPEGMAVGVVFAGVLSTNETVTLMGAISLAIGIAIQNFPEGAIISLPLKGEGNSKAKSFLNGMLSGIVEPVFAFLTILFADFINPVLPYLLAFAAGAMMYVVVEELIPEASREPHSNITVWGFAVGFVIMMVLDVALG